ncbi:MAG: hemerythrin protein [Herminiimonas sp.]|nr:hemerythrin protein [Herminiimonas sp.]
MPRQADADSSASDIIDILIEDHKKVSQLFAEFQTIKDRADDAAKQTLVEITCTELVIHSQVEEEFLYPALRDAFDETDLIDEAQVEHTMARQLISELESMQAGDELYDAKFKVLGEYVKHHIEEEQNRIFPKLKSTALDLETLGKDIRQRRDELRSEFGMPDEEFEEDEDDEKNRQAPRQPHHHH